MEGATASGGRTPAWVVAVAVAFAIAAVLALGLALLLLWRRDLRRIIDFYWRFRTIIAEYRRVMTEITDPDEQMKALEPLHEAHGAKIAQHLVALGGMYVKIGQFVSVQPDVPKVIREHMRILHDACRPLKSEELRRIVEAQLRCTEHWHREGGKSGGSAMEQVFSMFDMKPLGVASIGQVHRARLRHGSQDVVVKVQFPHAHSTFEADLWCIKTTIELLKGSKNWTYTAMCEIEQQLAQEFDFRLEAANIDTMRAVLLPELSKLVELPEVQHDLTTPSLVTMSFLDGVRLDRAIARKLEDSGLGDVAEVLRLSSGDEASAPIAPGVEDDGGRQPSEAQTPEAGRTKALAAADCQRIVQTLFEVWGHCVVRAGVFNADPHPGNVLLMPDGRLGLVDFGQVKQLSPACREAIASIIMGLLRADVPGTAETMRRMGIHVKLDDADTRLWYHASVVFERRGSLPWTDECWGKESGGLASEMVFVVRSLGLLRGVALGLGFPTSPAESWGKWAAQNAKEKKEADSMIEDIHGACCSGTYDLLAGEGRGEEDPSSVGTFTLHHARGSCWFGGSWSLAADCGGARREHRVESGFVCGRVLEMKAGGLVIRGVVREGGDRISHVRTWDLRSGEELARYTAVRTSGIMGQSFNSMKAKAAAAAFRLAPAATKARLVRAAMGTHQSAEHAPEG